MSTFLLPAIASQLLFKFQNGKKVVANLLRDVNNNDCLLKYLEDDADILAEFGAFESGVFKEHEDKIDAGEATALTRLVKDPSEEEEKTPPCNSVAAELVSQKRKIKRESIFADVSFIQAT
eukprot:snap_masked-scaffold_23-processed-gene-1.4-mRNA-1 protein AED:1.00 eAED:1.00 QI:0/0/0/0/1/1/3/0/120